MYQKGSIEYFYDGHYINKEVEAFLDYVHKKETERACSTINGIATFSAVLGLLFLVYYRGPGALVSCWVPSTICFFIAYALTLWAYVKRNS
jgi:hypothetical protein